MVKNFQELLRHKYLLYIFTVRDIKGRYKQTSVGVLWAVIQPVFLMLVFTVIFGKFLGVSSGDVPYPVFSYVALLPWNFINRSVSAGSQSLISFKNIITKIYFPREVIPLSTIVSSLVDFAIGFGVFLLMLLIYRIPLDWHFLFVLVILPIQIILVSGLALFLSTMTVFIRDMRFALPLLLQIWMYGSPVIYSVDKIRSDLKILFYFNPVVGIIEGYRRTILFQELPDWGFLGISLVASIILFLGGYWIFKKLEPHGIDIL